MLSCAVDRVMRQQVLNERSCRLISLRNTFYLGEPYSGKVTERDWTKWTQHNRRALRPLIDLRNKMRRQIVGRKWWKKLMKFRKKQFFRMRFHDIEKARSRRPARRRQE